MPMSLLNLPAERRRPRTATFDPADPTSYNNATSLTVYDSLGAAHTATLYFIKDAAANDWTTRLYVDGTAVGGANAIDVQQPRVTLHRPGRRHVTFPSLLAGHRRRAPST